MPAAVSQSTCSLASCRLGVLWAQLCFLIKSISYCAFQDYSCLPCAFDCIWSQVCCAVCLSLWGGAWTRRWKWPKWKLWTFTGLKSSEHGVDGNKHIDGGYGLDNYILDMCLCRRGKGKYRWCYICLLPLIVYGLKQLNGEKDPTSTCSWNSSLLQNMTCRSRPKTWVESGQILRLRNLYLHTLDCAFWVVF